MTAAAGVGSLKDDKYFKDNCQKIIDVRDSAMIELKKLGFSCTNSQANFIFAKHEKLGGKELYEKLKKHGVLVRHFDSERIKDYNRITVGSKKQMQIFLTAVQQILEESK
jgi:histidinol-phosphate aminotransferase